MIYLLTINREISIPSRRYGCHATKVLFGGTVTVDKCRADQRDCRKSICGRSKAVPRGAAKPVSEKDRVHLSLGSPIPVDFTKIVDLSTDMAQDFVHDADKRPGCIYYDATAGYVFFCGV